MDGIYLSDTNESIYAEQYDKEDNIYREEEQEFQTNFEVSKSAPDKQYVFGWANIAVNADGSIPFDWQGDVTSPEVLEKAAYEFCIKYRATGEMHEGDVKGHMIESVMFTKEKMAAMGIPEGTVPEGWWVGFHVPDPEVYAKIKDGTYKMFSIQGKTKRLKL